MTTTYYDGDLAGFGYDLCQRLHFIIDHVYRMTVGLQFFVLTVRIGIDEVFDIAKIEMPEQQNIFAR